MNMDLDLISVSQRSLQDSLTLFSVYSQEDVAY